MKRESICQLYFPCGVRKTIYPFVLIASLVALLMSSRSFAASIGQESFSANATVINFDELAGGSTPLIGEIVTHQYEQLGVTFINPDFVSRANMSIASLLIGQSDPNILFIRQNDDANPIGRPQMILFSSPMFRIGTFFSTSVNSTITMSAFSMDGTLLESATLSGVLHPGRALYTGFIGLEQQGGVGRVELYSRFNLPGEDNLNFMIDDLRFEPVPEPASCVVLVLGLSALAWVRRSRILKTAH